MSQRALSYPFRFEAGGVAASLTTQDIWRDRVYIAIFSGFGERAMRPSYGTVIATSLFQDMDDAEDIVREAVNAAFSNWLKDLSILSVNTNQDLDTSQLIVDVNYRLPTDEIDSVKLRVSLLDRTGQVIQEY